MSFLLELAYILGLILVATVLITIVAAIVLGIVVTAILVVRELLGRKDK